MGWTEAGPMSGHAAEAAGVPGWAGVQVPGRDLNADPAQEFLVCPRSFVFFPRVETPEPAAASFLSLHPRLALRARPQQTLSGVPALSLNVLENALRQAAGLSGLTGRGAGPLRGAQEVEVTWLVYAERHRPHPVYEPVILKMERVLNTQSHTPRRINSPVFSRNRTGQSEAWTPWSCGVPGLARSRRRLPVDDRDPKKGPILRQVGARFTVRT